MVEVRTSVAKDHLGRQDGLRSRTDRCPDRNEAYVPPVHTCCHICAIHLLLCRIQISKNSCDTTACIAVMNGMLGPSGIRTLLVWPSGTSFCLRVDPGSRRCVSRPISEELQFAFGPSALCTSTVSAALFDSVGPELTYC